MFLCFFLWLLLFSAVFVVVCRWFVVCFLLPPPASDRRVRPIDLFRGMHLESDCHPLWYGDNSRHRLSVVAATAGVVAAFHFSFWFNHASCPKTKSCHIHDGILKTVWYPHYRPNGLCICGHIATNLDGNIRMI